MKREQRIIKRRRGSSKAPHQAGGGKLAARGCRAPKAPRQSLDLPRPEFDQQRLATQTYLTVPELCQYGRFKSENATWKWLGLPANVRRVPKCRRGRAVTILRRDYDRAVQQRHAEQSVDDSSAAVGEA